MQDELDRIGADYIRGSLAGEVLLDANYREFSLDAISFRRRAFGERSDLRLNILGRLDALSDDQVTDRTAFFQLRDWVSSQEELMSSGEELRPFHGFQSPRYRLSRMLWASLLEPEVAWSHVENLLRAIADSYVSMIEPLTDGLAAGVLATRVEALAMLRECQSLEDADSPMLMDLVVGPTAIPATRVPLMRAGVETVRQGAATLAVFLRTQYLPHLEEADGVGADRYELWSVRELGQKIDLVEFHDSCWNDLRLLESEISSTANVLYPGQNPREVVNLLNEMPGGKVASHEALGGWFRRTIENVSEQLNGNLVNIPARYRLPEVIVSGTQAPTTTDALPPSPDFSRPGAFCVRPLGDAKMSTWSLESIVHALILPGMHLMNCHLADPRTPIRDFQRVLATHFSLSGWANYAMFLVADFARDHDDQQMLMCALHFRRRQLLKAACDVGLHLGLKIPAWVPAMGGTTWTRSAVEDAFEKLGMLPPVLASYEAERIARCPAYGLSGVYGSRIRDEALRSARQRAGGDFSFVSYHERVLKLPPVSSVALVEQLKVVAEPERPGSQELGS